MSCSRRRKDLPPKRSSSSCLITSPFDQAIQMIPRLAQTPLPKRIPGKTMEGVSIHGNLDKQAAEVGDAARRKASLRRPRRADPCRYALCEWASTPGTGENCSHGYLPLHNQVLISSNFGLGRGAERRKDSHGRDNASRNRDHSLPP